MEKKTYNFGQDVHLEFLTVQRNHRELTKTFRSGNSHIDEFVKKRAYNSKDMVTYMAVDKECQIVVAILSIACSGIYTTGKSLRYPFTVIPAIEVKYFAVNEAYQKLPYTEYSIDGSLSYQIFNKYIKDIIDISKNTCTAKKIILYSVKDAINFYKRFGFRDFKPYFRRDENITSKGCTPMFLSL